MSKPDESTRSDAPLPDDDFTFESSEQPIDAQTAEADRAGNRHSDSDGSSRHGSGSSHHSSSSGGSSHRSSSSSGSSHRSSSSGGSSHHSSSSSGSSHHSSSSSGSSHHSSSSSGSSHHSSSSSGSSHHSSSSSGSSHHSSSSSGSSRHSSSDDPERHSSSHHEQESREREHREALIGKYQIVAQDDILSDEIANQRRKHRRHRRRSRKRTIRRVLIALVSIPLALALILAGTLAVLNRIGRSQIQAQMLGVQPNPYSVTYDEGKSVEYDGHTYALNEDIVTFSAIGMDRETFGLLDDKIGTAGQADFIVVAAVDLNTGSVRCIMIPRDTLVDVDQFSVGGEYVGVEKLQICLAYAYGDGKDTSAQNVLTSAGRVLYGIPLQMYGVLDLDGIAVLNDAIGGVSLTLQENYLDAAAGQKITLHGDEAHAFVRSRDTSSINSDAARRARQIQYLRAYLNKVTDAARQDLGVIRRLYNAALEYGFTNVSLAKVTYLASSLLSKGAYLDDFTTLKGAMRDADPYPEFILDEKAAFETVLDIFYTQIA